MLLTNATMAELLQPLVEHLLDAGRGSKAEIDLSENAECELDAMIEAFSRAASIALVDGLSASAKAVLLMRLAAVRLAAERIPDGVMLELPVDADEAQQRVYAVMMLHRRTEDLLSALRSSLH